MFSSKTKASGVIVFFIAFACTASAPMLSQAFQQSDFDSQFSSAQADDGTNMAAVIADCNSDGFEDDPTDCNSNGQSDECDLFYGNADDCNDNGIPDECEVPTGGGETCQDAPTICPDITYYGTLKGKTRDWDSDCGSDGESPDVWYTYIPFTDCSNLSSQTAVNISVSVCSESFTPVVAIYDYCPEIGCLLCKESDALGVHGCRIDPCGSPFVTSVVTSRAYYIRVSGQYGYIGDGRYSLEITSADQQQPLCCAYAPANPSGGNDCNGDGLIDECQLTRRALLSLDYETGMIREISKTNAHTLSTIMPHLPNRFIEGATGLDQHPISGELWTIVYSYPAILPPPPIATDDRSFNDGPSLDLVRIDPRTGEAHVVAPIDMNYDFYELAFNADGSRLFIIADDSNDGEVLLEANQTDGTLTYLVEPTQGGWGEGIAFNTADGLLYRLGGVGSDVTTALPPQVFETITPDTLAATPLTGPTLHGFPTGMTYDADNSAYPFYVADAGLDAKNGNQSELWMQSQNSDAYLVGTMNHRSSGLALALIDTDCNSNGVPDECDIRDATSLDCNFNGLPDECENDCNNDSIPDQCEIRDCDGSPACGDCNRNGIPDGCEIAEGSENDCNQNGVPDSCELAADSLYGIDYDANRLYIFDKTTGEKLSIITITMQDQYIYAGAGLATHPLTGDLWAILIAAEAEQPSDLRGGGYRHLAIIDPLTGVATDIGRITDEENNRKFGAIAFDANGTLYGLTGSSGDDANSLFTFDQTDATAALFLGLPEICSESGFAMAYNPEDGLMYRVSELYEETEEAQTDFGSCTPMLEAINLELQSITSFALSGDETYDFKAMTWDAEAGRFLLAARADEGPPSSQPASDETELSWTNSAFMGLSTTGELAFITTYCPVVKGLAFLTPYGRAEDCNENGVPDDCEADCNSNGIADECDIANQTSSDCNGNGIPDECDPSLALGACPDNITVQATDETGIVVEYPTPAATGGCNPAVSIEPASGTLLPIGTTTVNVTATDELGGEVTCSFSVEVLAPDAPGGQGNPPGGQETPNGFCLPFIVQTLCGVPLCAGPCFAGGMLSSIVGLFGLRLMIRRRYRCRR